MLRLLALLLPFTLACFSFGQKKDNMKFGRFLTESIGNIGTRYYYSTEKVPSGSKLIEIKKDISIVAYTKKGFAFFTEEDEIKNFPKGYVVSKNFLYNEHIYAVIGKVNYKEEKTDFKIIEMDSNLTISNTEVFNFTFKVKDVFGLKIKLDSNLVAIVSKSSISKKKKENQIETIALNLENKQFKYSKLSCKTENGLIFSDMIINRDLIIQLAYSSHHLDFKPEKSKFKKLDKIESLFVRMDEEHSSLSTYDPHTNADFIPKNYKFLKLNNNDFYLVSIAAPTRGKQMGYFLSKNKFSTSIDFKNNQVLFPKNYTDEHWWRWASKRRMMRDNSPVKYQKQNLEEVFIHNKQLFFITLEYFSYRKLQAWVSSADSHEFGYFSTDPYTGSSTYNMGSAPTISSEGLKEGNFAFAVFDTAAFNPVHFFKTKKKYTLEGYYKRIVSDSSLVVFFPVIQYSKEFQAKKKNSRYRGAIIRLEYDLLKGNYEYEINRLKGHIYNESLERGHIVGDELWTLQTNFFIYSHEKKKFKMYKVKKNKKKTKT